MGTEWTEVSLIDLNLRGGDMVYNMWKSMYDDIRVNQLVNV